MVCVDYWTTMALYSRVWRPRSPQSLAPQYDTHPRFSQIGPPSRVARISVYWHLTGPASRSGGAKKANWLVHACPFPVCSSGHLSCAHQLQMRTHADVRSATPRRRYGGHRPSSGLLLREMNLHHNNEPCRIWSLILPWHLSNQAPVDVGVKMG